MVRVSFSGICFKPHLLARRDDAVVRKAGCTCCGYSKNDKTPEKWMRWSNGSRVLLVRERVERYALQASFHRYSRRVAMFGVLVRKMLWYRVLRDRNALS